MLGKTSPHTSGSSTRPRKARERGIDFHVVIPDADDAVTRRLVRHIQQSIDRTLAAEETGAVAPPTAEATADTAPARRTPAGCGAWWAF